MAQRTVEASQRPRDMAAHWLSSVLADGPVPVRTIKAEAEIAGLSWATVRRAGDNLGVVTVKTGYSAGRAWHMPKGPQPGEEIEL